MSARNEANLASTERLKPEETITRLRRRRRYFLSDRQRKVGGLRYQSKLKPRCQE